MQFSIVRRKPIVDKLPFLPMLTNLSVEPDHAQLKRGPGAHVIRDCDSVETASTTSTRRRTGLSFHEVYRVVIRSEMPSRNDFCLRGHAEHSRMTHSVWFLSKLRLPRPDISALDFLIVGETAWLQRRSRSVQCDHFVFTFQVHSLSTHR